MPPKLFCEQKETYLADMTLKSDCTTADFAPGERKPAANKQTYKQSGNIASLAEVIIVIKFL